MTAKKNTKTNVTTKPNKKQYIIWAMDKYDTLNNDYFSTVPYLASSSEEALNEFIKDYDYDRDVIYFVCLADGSEKPIKFKFGWEKLD